MPARRERVCVELEVLAVVRLPVRPRVPAGPVMDADAERVGKLVVSHAKRVVGASVEP